MPEQELFIGRKDELEVLERDIFVTKPGSGCCHSLIGPNDVGKTTLVRKAVEVFQQAKAKHVYYFATSIVATASYWDFWSVLIQDFSEVITEEKLIDSPNPDEQYINQLLAIYAFFNDDAQINKIGQRSFHNRATRYLNQLFSAYTNLGLHIILTIDEFDNARAAFPQDGGDGSFFQRLFTLTPKGASVLNLSILLISRRRAGTIAHHMSDGSDFEAGFPQITLRGFTDQELETYFDSYSELPCGKLDKRRRQDIIYFCGRHPGLLMKMRRMVEYHCDQGAQLNVGMLYRDYGLEMTTVYERMCKLMRTEYVNHERTLNCIGTFAQTFIGPSYEPQLPDRIEQIYKYGFLTKGYPGKKNIFHMAGLSEEGESGHGFRYEPLSPYFVEFFKNRILPDELDGLGKLLNQTELEIRRVILYLLKMQSPDKWEDILVQHTPEKKLYFRMNLDRLAAENDADARNLTFTNLDIMAFPDYARIIGRYWDLMKSYFSSFSSAAGLRIEFDFLKGARDCYAHNNAKVLDERSCAHLRELCARLKRDMENGEKAEKDAALAAMPAPSVSAQLELSGKTVVFCCKEEGRNGGLRGVLKETGFRAGISKRKLDTHNVKGTHYVGLDVQAVVIQWDANERLFWLDFVRETKNECHPQSGG